MTADFTPESTARFISEKGAHLRRCMQSMKRIDAGFAEGIGYTLMKGTGMSIGEDYYFGPVNALKETSSSGNTSIFLKINIPVGAAKKEE